MRLDVIIMEINKDIKISTTTIDGHSYIPGTTFKTMPMNSLYWWTNTSGWDNQLGEFKDWLKTDNAPIGAYLVDLSFFGAKVSAFVQKANNLYISVFLITYLNTPKVLRCEGGYWKDDINIPANIVEQAYLGNNPDIDQYHTKSGIYGLYNCTKTPNSGIGTLEVIYYSWDWVIQRFTTIEATPRMWERSFTGGNTWNAWIQRW